MKEAAAEEGEVGRDVSMRPGSLCHFSPDRPLFGPSQAKTVELTTNPFRYTVTKVGVRKERKP